MVTRRPSGLGVTVAPRARNVANSAAVYRSALARTVTSPRSMLCARYPTVANSLPRVALVSGR